MSRDFETFPILPEAYWYKGPKSSFHTPGLDAAVLSHLGAGKNIAPRETKGSVSFSANIADIAIACSILNQM